MPPAVSATATVKLGGLAGCTYHPSPLERLWTASPAAGRICEIATSDDHVAASREWLAYAESARGATSPVRAPASMSRWQCADGRVEYIEPLVGVARHPFARVGCNLTRHGGLAGSVNETDIYDISYLVLASRCLDSGDTLERERSHRRLFYDLGCTTYGNGTVDLGHGGARSPSLPLFDELYAGQCLALDQLYGWEMTSHNPREWWRDVPASARPRVSFYNVPIEEDFHSAASFSSFLRASAQPDDFVSVKVDIDYVQAELPIVMGIARRPELTALVDELFFEYHFNFDELDFGWRSQTGARNHVNDTVDDALSLMSELRRAGVRSHFWI